MKKLLIVDGNSILNRAYYGIRPLSNKEGLPTNALFGMMTILKRHLDTVKPDYTLIAFDLKAKTFRHKEYDFYKANRKPMPEDLAIQLPYAKELVRMLGFNVCELEGYEADDIIGTASRLAPNDVHSYILTGDRDSLQLINEHTSVILAKTKEDVLYTPDKFFEDFGVTPLQYIDVKAIMGDSSDNIPGIAGIGEKGAFKLISDFGSLDNIYAEFEGSSLTPGMKDKIRNGREMAYASKYLATIVLDVPLGKAIDDFVSPGMDKFGLRKSFLKFEFGSLIKKFGLENIEATEPQIEIKPTVSLAEFEGCESIDSNSDGIGGEQLDFGFGEEKAEIKPVSFVLSNDIKEEVPTDFSSVYSIYFDGENALASSLSGINYRFPISDGAIFFKSASFICHDVKSILKTTDINCIFDTMLAGYVISPSDSSYDLGALSLAYLDMEFNEAYASQYVSALFVAMSKHLERDGTTSILTDIEIPLAYVLSDMEKEGFKVDTNGLKEFSSYLSKMEEEHKTKIFELAGEEFNVNSPKQLGEILFGKLKLPHGKKTKSGYSTGAEILEELADEYEIVKEVLEYRKVAKLNSTYAEGLMKVADENGIIHTTFNQTVAVTGRLSSTEPNLQNIPIRTELGKNLRKYFTTKKNDYVLIDADYSQIELKVLAHLSRDANMIHAFNNGIDIHTLTASLVFGVSPDEVTSELRKRAKAVNFGIVYGIGDFSLGKDLGISRKEARAYIDSYFATYPDVHIFIERLITDARNSGFARTMMGRIRYIPELKAKNKMVQAFGERAAMNSPIQGTAADIIKIAMINVAKALKDAKIDARLILQVHDELIIEAHKNVKDEALKILKTEMEGAIKLSVPLTADTAVGKTWFDAK
ncbi:MAG: DNA polymerase I [Ruminococcaceae bacterium]|nr:DNA polymerase I [Oscillospiraceae bacterium]